MRTSNIRSKIRSLFPGDIYYGDNSGNIKVRNGDGGDDDNDNVNTK